MTLFENSARQQLDRHAPLAARMRPRSFDEFVGQEHIVGPDTVLRRSIEADRIPSIILWGPPGTGKTTLANLIANVTKSHFSSVSPLDRAWRICEPSFGKPRTVSAWNDGARSCSSTRYIASTRRSRT
jgi:replication-associated recombination protein RarA